MSFERFQIAYDNASPDDYDVPRCPVCGAEMKRDRWCEELVCPEGEHDEE